VIKDLQQLEMSADRPFVICAPLPWSSLAPTASFLTHSFASRFCDGERFFGSAVLCEDGFGAGGPPEGLWVLVSMLDPVVNRGLEFGDVVEGSSPDALASDFGEEPLDEVEPGSRRT